MFTFVEARPAERLYRSLYLHARQENNAPRFFVPQPRTAMTQRTLSFICLTGTLLLGACDGDIHPPTMPAETLSPAANVSKSESQNDLVATQRFSLSLTASGSLKPGTPIQLHAQVRANLQSQQAEVRIVVPEAQLARLGGWQSNTIKPGTAVAALVRLQKSFAAFGEATLLGSITIDKPGLYRAVATVVDTIDPGMVGGKYVQNVAQQEIWLLVDSAGGHVVDHYDPSLLPAGSDDATPGPAQPKQRKLVLPYLCTCYACPYNDGCGPPPPTPQYTVLFTFWNSDYGTYDPVAGAYYTIDSNGGNANGPFTRLTDGYTDASGKLAVDCSSTYYIINIYARTNGTIELQNGVGYGMKYYQTATNVCNGVNFTQSLVADRSDVALVFTNMRLAVDSSRAFFGRSRGNIIVNYDSGSSATPFYSIGSDQITITNVAVRYDYGRFTAAHEYGHALAQASLSGSRPGGCPSSGHYADSLYTMLCAISEGWADYHAAASQGSNLGYYYYKIRDNSYYHGGDGSLGEGPVASTLFDISARSNITDPYAGFDLALHYPGSYVADIFKTCQIRDSSWIRNANGIDDMVYCFEQQIDPNVSATYFQSRPPYSRALAQSQQASTPGNWSAANLRRVWLHKLYGL